MCLGVHFVHEQCQHLKKFNVVEACNQATRAGCTNLTTLHVITITAPRLCVSCFRQKEAEIDAEYEAVKRNMKDEIARVDLRFTVSAWGRLTEGQARNLRGYREECEDNVVQAKAARDLSIRLFRQRQGVWGDG